MDSLLYLLVYPQRPLLTTRTIELVGYDKLGAGQNATVAVMSYSGYDIEDAIVMNKSSLDRGFGRCIVMKKYAHVIEKYRGASDRLLTPLRTGSGSERMQKLDNDGIATPGEIIRPKDVLLNKEVPIYKSGSSVSSESLRDSAYRPAKEYYKGPEGETCVLDRVSLSNDRNGNPSIKFLIRHTRRPELGDKFSSRHGQKGVCGIIIQQEDFPFSERGICPDLIMNPHVKFFNGQIFMGGNEEKRRIHWVNWNTVCKPLNSGGLGVLDLNISNWALLGKWVWKFANEKNSLWKSVLCSKHKNDSEGDCLRSYSKLKVGNGKSFILDSFELNGWVWNIQTRRNLCNWELDQWLDLMTKLKDLKLSDSVEDFLSWGVVGIVTTSCRSFPIAVSSSESGSKSKIGEQRNAASFWDLALVFPKDPHLLSCWGELRVKSLIWKFIPGVVFWSIWKARNAMVFEGSTIDRQSLFFFIRFRLSKWFLAKYPKFPIQEDVLIGDPSLADGIQVHKLKDCKVNRWIPPPVDYLKMNVDGAVRLDGSDGGIGGILRDWNSCTLLNFSENVGQGPPPVAELKAIKRGIEVFLSSCWVSVSRLIVESDCKSAVDWIQSPALAPVFLLPLVKEISTLISDRVHSVRLIPRACNGEADSLAKKGIGKMIELLGSKAGVSCGRFHYGSAFGEPSGHADKVETISETLIKHGFSYNGKDFIYSGFWGVRLALPSNPPSLLSSWEVLRPNSVIWQFILGVVFWSIWKIRNEIIFDKGKLDIISLFFTVRFRLAKWFLAKFPLITLQVDSLIGDPTLADNLTAHKTVNNTVLSWIPPPVDFFKMNVDGAVSSVWRLAGIGGILRDWNRVTLTSFSEKVGPATPILAELKAIKRGIDFFLSSSWASKGRLIIESDSKTAVEWINDGISSPVFLANFVKDIVYSVSARQVVIRWIPRCCNCEADKLAKEGIG
ncbi:hypothetical protein F3Y22_tig00116962pilonHSYRG00458 [Hibiscus syriacus]|uniref:DNA-directed RNA polymerase n=1 Tax=Hibiscus syriacus TaxID=106335 RepID=A0A6A2XT72_HIBSY|nr:hypothetical protein F3Y22_tig00116962pilonHSYRG00458 [Hibiscus syriacus]